MTPDDIKDLLGEGFHTAFRKATDCDQAHPIWELIRDMPADDWRSVLEMVYDHVVVPAVQAERERVTKLACEHCRAGHPMNALHPETHHDVPFPAGSRGYMMASCKAQAIRARSGQGEG